LRERAKKFIYLISEKKLTVSTAAIILGSTYLISNILGLFRERLVAARFGASHMTDIFYASFKIPDVIYNLIVLGAVSSAFIPIFVDYLSAKKKEESDYIASNFMNFLLLIMIVVGAIVYLLAWKLVPLLLPGFFQEGVNSDFNTLKLAVWSVRAMLLSPILFSLSAVFGGILNSHKRFISYALAPVVYNLSIIFGIIYLSPLTEIPIHGVLYGVIIGAFLHAAIQFGPALMTGFRWKPVLDLRKYELPRIIKLTIPRLLAMGAQQVNIIVDTIVASFFVGGITHLTFANNIQTVPTVIFGIAIATAVFPLLAEQKSKGLNDDFKKTLSESTRKILYYMIPASIGIWVLRAQIVRLVYGAGNFGWESTYWTTKALGFFAIGIVAQGLIPLFLRAFYAIKDTKTPLIISIVTMAVNTVFALTLPFITALELGVAGVTVAFSIAGFVNIILLYALLQGKIGRIDRDNKIFSAATKIFVSSLVMGLLVHYSLRFFDVFVDNTKVMGLLMQTTGAIAIGAGFYFLVTYLFRLEETGRIFRRSPQA
jgi:putative peptidoglycan lipid II flippase